MCETQKMASRLQNSLVSQGVEANRVTAEPAGFANSVLVCSPRLSKALEFERVIVTGVSAAN